MTSRRPKKSDNKHSMKTVIVFCAVVGLIIMTSIFIKIASVWKNNKFDGAHSFTLAIRDSNDAELIIFSPETKSVSFLTVRYDNLRNKSLSRELGVVVNENISGGEFFSSPSDLASYLLSQVLKVKNKDNQLTPFDYLRLGFLAKSADSAKSVHKEIKMPLSDPEINSKIGDMFLDQSIAEDNVSVEILNASGVLGAGNEIARVLGHIGINVISVRTSPEIKKYSSLTYSGKKTYTLNKISSLTKLSPVISEANQLSDIILTIGDDGTAGYIFRN